MCNFPNCSCNNHENQSAESYTDPAKQKPKMIIIIKEVVRIVEKIIYVDRTQQGNYGE